MESIEEDQPCLIGFCLSGHLMLQPTAGMCTEYLGHRSATHHDASEVPARCRLSGNLQAKFRIITVVVAFV